MRCLFLVVVSQLLASYLGAMMTPVPYFYDNNWPSADVPPAIYDSAMKFTAVTVGHRHVYAIQRGDNPAGPIIEVQSTVAPLINYMVLTLAYCSLR